MRWVLAVLAALPYVGALANDFVWDDRLQILGNAQLASLSTALGYFGRLEGLYYRPLVFVGFAAETAIAGKSAVLFHLTNVALHAANAVLVFALAERTGVTRMAAFFGAAAFAVHPLQSEAVAYIAGRTDLLMTAASLVACLAVLPPGEERRASPARGALAAAATAVAILSKETGYALVLLLPWLAWRHLDAWKDRLTIAAPSVGAAVLLAVLRPGWGSATLVVSLANAGRTAFVYARLLFWPSGLQVDRLTPVGGAAWIAVALALAALFVYGLSRRGAVADWTAWTAAFYAPVANLVALYPGVAGNVLFTPEHNLYAPMAGIGVLAALSLSRLAEPRLAARAVATAATVVLCAWGARTWARVGDWRDEVTLFGAAVRQGSISPRVWFNLGNDLLRVGNRQDALAAYGRATELAPGDDEAWANLGVVLQLQGRLDEALVAYGRAEALRPSARLYRNLATLHRARGDEAAAARALSKAAQFD